MYHLLPPSKFRDELLNASIVKALNCAHSEYSRAKVLVAVRALKIIKQQVMSRTIGVAGPLLFSLSIAGNCGVSPSSVGAINAMGLFLSYETTEKYN